MNKQFILGFITALIMNLIISCSVATLEAGSGDCGEESWNPCYVKIVD